MTRFSHAIFDANRRGFFESYTIFIEVDKCQLKGIYKVVLLFTINIGANYSIYLLGICIVENENTELWVYFIEKLYKQISCDDVEGLYFMSDRQKGF